MALKTDRFTADALPSLVWHGIAPDLRCTALHRTALHGLVPRRRPSGLDESALRGVVILCPFGGGAKEYLFAAIQRIFRQSVRQRPATVQLYHRTATSYLACAWGM